MKVTIKQVTLQHLSVVLCCNGVDTGGIGECAEAINREIRHWVWPGSWGEEWKPGDQPVTLKSWRAQ